VWREHRGTLAEHLPGEQHSLIESVQRPLREFIWVAELDKNEIRLSQYDRRPLEDFIVESKRTAVLLAKDVRRALAHAPPDESRIH
jgi:hypothetical protein